MLFAKTKLTPLIFYGV